jgi:hypothetical protein
MNKTAKLMSSITASLLALGSATGSATTMFNQEAQETKPDDSWKTDPAVRDNADSIMAWLEGTTSSTAKSMEDVAKQFPQFTQEQIQKALDRLRYEGQIKRSGDGTKDSPYRYYETPSHGRGG